MANVVKVGFVADEARAEFRVGELLVRQYVGDVGLLAHVVGDVQGQGIVGYRADNDVFARKHV